MDSNGLLLFDNRIYVPSAGNLHTHILQYNHDHILARHFGQNKTLDVKIIDGELYLFLFSLFHFIFLCLLISNFYF